MNLSLMDLRKYRNAISPKWNNGKRTMGKKVAKIRDKTLNAGYKVFL